MSEVPYFVDLQTATDIACATPLHLNTEFVPLDAAYKRVVSEDIASKVNDPPFDNSAMDGFAFLQSDSLDPPTTLSIIQTLQAGDHQTKQPLGRHQATRIMTGAPLPPGADSVLPIELCQVSEDGTEVPCLNKAAPISYAKKVRIWSLEMSHYPKAPHLHLLRLAFVQRWVGHKYLCFSKRK